MLQMRNNWTLIDSDCMQCEKQVDNHTFKLVEVVWLDTVGDDPRAENAKDEFDNYVVRAAEIDIDLVSKRDIECAISSFGYESIENLMDSYGEATAENMYPLLAEMLFESDPYGSTPISTTVSWADAEAIIQKIIDDDEEKIV